MAEEHNNGTPLLDELEKGSWPSFVTQIREMAGEGKEQCKQLLDLLERSYRRRSATGSTAASSACTGMAAASSAGTTTSRTSSRPSRTSTRCASTCPPAGSTPPMRYARSATSGTSTDPGSPTCTAPRATSSSWGPRPTSSSPPSRPSPRDFDLGGSGSDVRTPSACVGPARCEWACYDTLDLCNDLTQTFQDELHRPAFPYKFKFKCSGCPNDCVASIARSDMSIIGTWRDEIRIDQDEVRAYAEGGMNIERDICGNCPTKCMAWDGNELEIDDANCVKCMHCINAMPKALRPGTDTGATILLGAKAPIVQGAQLLLVLVPFMKLEPLRGAEGPGRADLGFLGRARQEPGARRRAHPARRAGELPRGHRGGADPRDDRPPEGQSVRLLRGILRRGKRWKRAPKPKKRAVTATPRLKTRSPRTRMTTNTDRFGIQGD